MTGNRTTELLPCPFCGGKAALRMCWMEDGHRYRAVECVECGATTPGNYSEVGDQSAWDWNTRTPVEYEGWFYLPKPKNSLVRYGTPQIEKMENGYKAKQPVEVIESAIRAWGDELGEHIMKRICEVWDTRTHGTLTAEQVKRIHEVIEKHWHDLPAEYDMPEATALPEYSYDWQAIADELNAELGSGTCKITATATNNLMYPDYMTKWYELSCGHSLTLKGDEAPKWCAVCGKVVKR